MRFTLQVQLLLLLLLKVEGSVNTQCNSLQINLLRPMENRGGAFTSHASNVEATGLATVNDELFPLYNDGCEGIPIIPYNAFAQFQQANDLQVPNIGYDADDFDLSLMPDFSAMNVIGAEPGLRFTRETWWDALLSQYALIHDGTASLTVGLRQAASRRIMMDLRKLFRSLPYWFSFINVPRFFGALLDPSTRNTLQPSLILSALAMATFFQSSESELGLHGRVRALALQEQAQSALEASLNAGWIDCGLVQASMLMGSLKLALIRSRARSGSGRLGLVQTEPAAGMQLLVVQYGARMSGGGGICTADVWMPAWTDVSEGEIRKEECRRLAWSSLMVAASHTSYNTSDSAFSPQMDLFIMDSANYALLFPGEHLKRKHGLPSPPSKNSIWALFVRIMLLWHSCVRMRSDPSLSDAEKAQFAITAWLEMDAIEDAMDRHTCGTSYISCRDARYCLTHGCTFLLSSNDLSRRRTPVPSCFSMTRKQKIG
ncbi:hypothetical protein A0H81_09165 [Grifola frondosa]|uniref:Transcription factor domain-containing protein n=1 Tax=Grifola frondosa TaxID=5627 RepID=A0A1C7M6I0_GRIFR|nr:hypothetical protein A0H81_09165 [Grifola frondosa]